LLPVLLTKYYSAVQIKKNEMDGTCSTYGGDERCIPGLVGKPDGMRLLGIPRHIYGKIILKWLLKKWDMGVYGIDLAQERGRGGVL
jgi:hypothetical protein